MRSAIHLREGLAIEGGKPVRRSFLPFGTPCLDEEEVAEVVATLRSGWIGTGPRAQQLEEQFAAYVGANFAVSLNSCTAGLFLSLKALKIGPGDAVLTSPFTFAATANVIEHVGARPVFVDIDPITLNIDPQVLAHRLTQWGKQGLDGGRTRPKALIAVHFGGLPCDMDALDKVAANHGLHVIEDAAHAVGARYHGRMVGSLSSFTGFSFYAYHFPFDTTNTNVLGTLNVLQACREAGIERLVHTSTSEVYGTAVRVPMDEDHPLRSQSPYSASKIGGDKLAESYYCAFGLPVVTVRPFNTYGPRQSSRAVIPTIIVQALTGREVHLGNLEPRRDLTYVSDTVQGFLCAAQTPGVEGRLYNLGTGCEISIGDLAHKIIRLVNRQVHVVMDQERQRPQGSEVQRLMADARRARAELGWEPLTSLEDGLRSTIRWVADHLGLYQPGRYLF